MYLFTGMGWTGKEMMQMGLVEDAAAALARFPLLPTLLLHVLVQKREVPGGWQGMQRRWTSSPPARTHACLSTQMQGPTVPTGEEGTRQGRPAAFHLL